MLYQRGLPGEPGLTASPERVDAPTLWILTAAFRSLSNSVWQVGHSHVLSRRFSSGLIAPQTWQVLLEGYHLSMNRISVLFLEVIYLSFCTKSEKPKSETLRPQRDFMPLRLSVSSEIQSYLSVRSWASFQWKVICALVRNLAVFLCKVDSCTFPIL